MEQGWRFGSFPQQRGGHMIPSWNQALLFAMRQSGDEEPQSEEGGYWGSRQLPTATSHIALSLERLKQKASRSKAPSKRIGLVKHSVA